MESVKEKRGSISILMKLFRGVVNFAKRPKMLFWFFIVLNLIPSILLIFTEPLSGLGKFILVAAPFGIYLILFSLLKRSGLIQLILIPLLIFHAFQLVLFYLFGESVIAVDMFLNLPTTNASEAGELLGSIWPAVVLVCVLYIPTIVLAVISVHHKVNYPRGFRRHTIMAGGILLVLCSGCVAVEKSRHKDYEVKSNIYPINVFYNFGYAIHKWNRSEAYPETSKDFTYNAKRDSVSGNREIYVLVIGEASRAGNWSLWGYERETSPHLKDVGNLVLYKDALTQSNTTHKSVPLILSVAEAKNYEILYTHKSIITAFKEVGFKTLFLSNQIPNRSFTDYFAAEADIHVVIRVPSEGGLITANNYDGELVPLVKHYIDSLEQENLFIVLHTYGSHFNYRERYPSEFARFKPDEATDIEYKNKEQLINAYDNSILYTDYFLSQLIGTLKGSGTESVLLYSSDHAEDLLDDNRKKFLHASPIPTYYQIHIPIFMWFSDSYMKQKPSHYEEAVRHQSFPIATNAISHTLLDVADIKTPYLDSTLSLVNAGFKRQPRMYLDDHDKPINYYLVGLKKQDKEVIKKLGLDHSLE